jgi:hypothetical protein
MKKIIIASLALATIAGLNACKKTNKVVSTVETASIPTITLSGDQFYSIPINGALPTISATAYDSVRKEVCVTKVEAGTLDNKTPGLYPVAIRATNSLGMYSKQNVFVAVTDVPAAFDLSGNYRRTAGAMGIAEVSKVKTGLYYSSNIFGATAASSIAGFYFLHVNDSTIIIPVQETDFGSMEVSDVTFKMVPGGDTLYKYALQTLTTNSVIRTFIKEQ